MNKMSSNSVYSVKLGWTKCYLLKCTGGYLLIDTDYQKYYARFEKKLSNLGIATSDIKYLLLTHHHDDHAGFAAELVRRTGCRVIAHRNAVSALEEGKSEGLWSDFLAERFPVVMLSKKAFSPERTKACPERSRMGRRGSIWT